MYRSSRAALQCSLLCAAGSVAPRRSLGSPSVKAVRRGFRRRPHTSHSMGFAFSAVVYASGYIFLMFVAVCLGARRAASSVTIVESEVLP